MLLVLSTGCLETFVENKGFSWHVRKSKSFTMYNCSSYCSKSVQQSFSDDCHHTFPESATEKTVIYIKELVQEHKRNDRIDVHNHKYQDKDGEELSSYRINAQTMCTM